jgi:8-oxo-dGTP diphosphatase
MENVLLIHKNRPDWQKGKLNGPGGKLEENETPHECVSREINEETTLAISPEKWTLVAELFAPEWNVKFFGTVHASPTDAKTTTDEKVEWISVKKLPENVIPNLQWLIPLCKNKLLLNETKMTKVEYHQ